MRILEQDLQAHVTAVMMSVKHAVEDARSQGLIAELPDKFDFEVEIVTAAQSLQSSTVTNDTETTDGTETHGTGTMIRTEGILVETQVEQSRNIVATEVSSTGQETDIASRMGGGDNTTVDYTY